MMIKSTSNWIVPHIINWKGCFLLLEMHYLKDEISCFECITGKPSGNHSIT